MRQFTTYRRGGRGPNARTAFSMVELMIAMTILFFGLLVIGAALPVGMDYSRRTADAAIGEDAANYGMQVITGRVRTSEFIDPRNMDNIFRPRFDFVAGDPNSLKLIPPPVLPTDPNNIPIFKVRPLVVKNVDASPDTEVRAEQTDRTELAIAHWIMETPTLTWLQEYNISGGVTDLRSAIPSVLRVYPPISADDPKTVGGFFVPAPTAPYLRDRITIPAGQTPSNGAESVKARDRLVGWTAFYRRVSYAANSDPLLYEVIVVATRRPTVKHRFAQQRLSSLPRPDRFVNPAPRGVYAGGSRTVNGSERLAPVPWLVHFTSLPNLSGFYSHSPLTNPNRTIMGATEPATIEFRCSLEVGELLHAGSVIIPALNDPNNSIPAQPGGPGTTGFVPHSPESLPIYEVTDRILDGSEYRIIVKNNHTYPWVDPSLDANAWPAWIIPPTVKSEAGQTHVFEKKSPIIGVARRYVRFPEVN